MSQATLTTARCRVFAKLHALRSLARAGLEVSTGSDAVLLMREVRTRRLLVGRTAWRLRRAVIGQNTIAAVEYYGAEMERLGASRLQRAYVIANAAAHLSRAGLL